ncbi:MAG TPA: hypothetical protein VFQ61_20455 [Polyangiaceae bacterium]|nr:hypothetical protein [Polyangiaceae bacterium]
MHLTSSNRSSRAASRFAFAGPSLRFAAVTLMTVACSASSDPVEHKDGTGGSSPAATGGANGNTSGATGFSGSGFGGFTSAQGGVTSAQGGATSATGGAATGGATSAAGGTTAANGGATVVANGGTTATGAGGTTATGAGGTATSSCATYSGTLKAASTIFMEGYGTSGTWMGYAYTYKYGTATITPGSSQTQSCFPGAVLCAAGSVPATYDDGAGIGWSINQAKAGGTPDTVALTGTVKVQLAGATAGMRVGLQPAGTAAEFCYELAAADVTAANGTGLSLPVSSFKSKCYDTATAVAYAGEPIQAIQISIPGTKDAVRAFDVCIVSISGG